MRSDLKKRNSQRMHYLRDILRWKIGINPVGLFVIVTIYIKRSTPIIAFVHQMSLIAIFSYFRSWMVLCKNRNKEHLTSWFLRRSNNNTPYRILESNSILTTEIFCWCVKDISWYLCTYIWVIIWKDPKISIKSILNGF